MGLLWGFGTSDTLSRRIGSGFVFSQRPCKPRLIKSAAESTKSRKRRMKLFPLCRTLASHLLCSSCVRSISVSPPCLSLAVFALYPLSIYLSLAAFFLSSSGCRLKWRMERSRNSLVSRLRKQEEVERASLRLTGYTACQPCSLGSGERFCTPSPPPPSCPGSSVRSPSFPRLQETDVSQKLHSVGFHLNSFTAISFVK